MGIPFYFFRICQKYKNDNIVYESNSETSDILYFDYNSLIHPCVAEYLNGIDKNSNHNVIEEELIDVIIEYTEYIISVINPRKKVVIAIDGVAPRAKMNQQRERRYKKAFLDTNENMLFDTNMITPGTPFMKYLNLKLKEHNWKFTTSNGRQVIITDSSEIGEGEHKIMKMIKRSSSKFESYYLWS
jgi:5'-3' exoribonuclease 1